MCMGLLVLAKDALGGLVKCARSWSSPYGLVWFRCWPLRPSGHALLGVVCGASRAWGELWVAGLDIATGGSVGPIRGDCWAQGVMALGMGLASRCGCLCASSWVGCAGVIWGGYCWVGFVSRLLSEGRYGWMGLVCTVSWLFASRLLGTGLLVSWLAR